MMMLSYIGRCSSKSALLGGFLAFTTALLGACDTVRLSNTSTSENGLLIDARTLSGPDNDKGFVSGNSSINVGFNRQRSGTNEVVAFTNRRPVTLRQVANWRFGNVTVPVNYADEIAIPVKVWIVKGPFDQQVQKAIDAAITTSVIWTSERIGVRFAAFDVVDATADPDAANYFAFTCAKQAGIESDIGKTSGQINIYYVDNVDGGTGRGQACNIGSDFVAMGKNTGDELLSHELGHDVALTHIDDLTTNFDQTNIMHSASNTREFITEGQVYRAHLQAGSGLNFLYNSRPGQPTRPCSRDAFSDTCPRIERRLWADGAFPAN